MTPSIPSAPDRDADAGVGRASRGTLGIYVAAVFIVAWSLWVAADQLSRSLDAGIDARSLLYLPGTFAPAIVALVLVAVCGGRDGVVRLLSGLSRWDVSLGWYVLALFFMAAVKLAAAAGHRLLFGAWPQFGTVPVYALFAAALLTAPFQVGEELGWRGLVLPALVDRIGGAAAGIALGLIWALWHVPLFLLPGADMVGQPMPVFIASVTALSVVMTWVWHRTGGSLPVLMLMHAAVNNTTGIVPASTPGSVDPFTLRAAPIAWLTAAVLVATALPLLFALRKVRTARPAPPRPAGAGWTHPQA